MSDAFKLDAETVLVTGGGTGLGYGIAQAMLEAGATVILVGRRENILEEAARRLDSPNVFFQVHDVTDLEEAPRLIEVVEKRHGPVTTLVNNAGNLLKKPALETTSQEFQQILDTHVLGVFELTKAVVPSMLKQGRGSILLVASMVSLFGVPQVIAYTAAKTAVVGLVRGLAVELSGNGIRVNAIAPGWIESAMSRGSLSKDPERERRILERTPMRRLGEPLDVGQAAVFLSSPAAKFITGVVLPVDGGASIGF